MYIQFSQSRNSNRHTLMRHKLANEGIRAADRCVVKNRCSPAGARPELVRASERSGSRGDTAEGRRRSRQTNQLNRRNFWMPVQIYAASPQNIPSVKCIDCHSDGALGKHAKRTEELGALPRLRLAPETNFERPGVVSNEPQIHQNPAREHDGQKHPVLTANHC